MHAWFCWLQCIQFYTTRHEVEWRWEVASCNMGSFAHSKVQIHWNVPGASNFLIASFIHARHLPLTVSYFVYIQTSQDDNSYLLAFILVLSSYCSSSDEWSPQPHKATQYSFPTLIITSLDKPSYIYPSCLTFLNPFVTGCIQSNSWDCPFCRKIICVDTNSVLVHLELHLLGVRRCQAQAKTFTGKAWATIK